MLKKDEIQSHNLRRRSVNLEVDTRDIYLNIKKYHWNAT